MSLTNPLELENVLSVPERRLDAAAVMDVLLITLFLSMLGSRFIFAPGMTMDLALELPVSSQSTLAAVPTDAVLTVKVLTAKQDNMYIFNGNIYTKGALEQMFRSYDKTLNEGREAILLVKADNTVTMATFTDLVDLARLAGFSKIQLAAQSQAQTEEDTVPLENWP
jgi:biopolymer transport protein ExbD